MARKLFIRKALSSLSKIILKRFGNFAFLKLKPNNTPSTQLKVLKHSSLLRRREEVQDQLLVFHLEGALLKSCSLFPYFMLVAFEAGGPLRALILLLLYPLILLVGRQLGLKILVFVCFAGMKSEFRCGSAILPKFLLEDVGCESFDVVMSYKRKVAVTGLPRIMVEGFLKDYLGVDAVLGRELKVINGHFSGFMDKEKEVGAVVNELLGDQNKSFPKIGLGSSNKFHNRQLFSHFKEVYLVSEAEKRNWEILPREKYPKPLIFHDGRLAFRPTPVSTLVMFLWLPLGFLVNVIRTASFVLLPFKVSAPILAYTGMIITVTGPKISTLTGGKEKRRGLLYVCNHRTLLDPLYIAYCIQKPVSAVTYSVSRFSELISPIKTVRLTRDREKDGKMMKKLLGRGDLVVCPEGTTCREPYLLRFSPLFAELTDEIVPVAIDIQVNMFHGSTASGCKCLDSSFLLMNPSPFCSVKILEKLSSSATHLTGGKSRFEVANHVQSEIAKVLQFECTNLTRKDKYLILAGNEGIVSDSRRPQQSVH